LARRTSEIERSLRHGGDPFENQFVDVSGLASVKDWSGKHSLSIIDEDRLVDLDLQARRRSMNQAAGKAREAAGEGEVDVLDDLVMTSIGHDHDHAGAQEESIRERVNFMDQANARGQETGVVQRIGEAMQKADWLEAINLLKAKAPGEHCRVSSKGRRGRIWRAGAPRDGNAHRPTCRSRHRGGARSPQTLQRRRVRSRL
jgi:hypothetical protein